MSIPVLPSDPDLPNEEIDLYAPEGSWSLLKLLHGCPATRAAIEAIPAATFEKTEQELLKKPNEIQTRLKISFWNEVRRAQRMKCEMVLTNVFYGVCSKSYWQKQVCPHPDILCWVITPPTTDLIVWQEILELGYRKLRRVLKLPLVEKRYWKDKSGEVHVEKRTNVALVKEIRSIVENMQNRLHGAVVQRQEIQSKSLTVKVDATQADRPKSASEDMEEIRRMLARIERVAGALPELEAGVVIDGSITEDKP